MMSSTQCWALFTASEVLGDVQLLLWWIIPAHNSSFKWPDSIASAEACSLALNLNAMLWETISGSRSTWTLWLLICWENLFSACKRAYSWLKIWSGHWKQHFWKSSLGFLMINSASYSKCSSFRCTQITLSNPLLPSPQLIQWHAEVRLGLKTLEFVFPTTAAWLTQGLISLKVR